ncbi:MAG: N-6 DNA methylase [Anaeromyxobacter sp.]
MDFLEHQTADKLRGGYYTPPALARFLARWVLAARPRRILEPSCGDGAFLRAVAAEAPRFDGELLGIELQGEEAAKAREAARAAGLRATVLQGDLLAWALAHDDARPGFDAALGNPPYVRYQFLSEEAQQRAEQLFAKAGLPFTRHVNLWVPFVLAALRQLRPGGRLAMVIPAELLHVLHAGALREALVAGCSRVVVVDPAELWFEDALQGTVLLLCERAAAGAPPAEVGVVAVRGAAFLRGSPERLFRRAACVPGDRLGGKWMTLFLPERTRALLEGLSAAPGVRRLGEAAEVDVGIVTGANAFFLVDDATVEAHGLHAYARPMFGRSEHVRGVIHDARRQEENRKSGLPAHFLDLSRAGDRHPPGLRHYLALGEAQGLPRRYKCRTRSPWYVVPSVWPAPVSLLKRAHDLPRLVLNEAGALTTDTAYRLVPQGGTDPGQLVAAFVNSLTALTAELEGRHYGGGVLELVPSEIRAAGAAAPGPQAAAADPRPRVPARPAPRGHPAGAGRAGPGRRGRGPGRPAAAARGLGRAAPAAAARAYACPSGSFADRRLIQYTNPPSSRNAPRPDQLAQPSSTGPRPGRWVRSGMRVIPNWPSRNRSSAVMTPMSAPPAMKPDAISVPRSWRAAATFSSFDDRLSSQAVAAPRISGELRSMGRYMPSARARPETPHISAATAKTAPRP